MEKLTTLSIYHKKYRQEILSLATVMTNIVSNLNLHNNMHV
jgi:hypothetical protein